MMDLAELISDIKKDGKVSTDALLMMLSEAVTNGDDPKCTYKEIYKKAYGEHLSEEICKEWVSKMTYGEHWDYDQCVSEGQKVGINWQSVTKYEWYCMLNAAYSDYRDVGIEYQIEEDPDFYAGLAKAFWCNDNDVKGKTLFSYYFHYAA